MLYVRTPTSARSSLWSRQWNSWRRVQKTEAQLFSAEQKESVIPNEMVVRSLVAASQFPVQIMKELLVVKVQSKVNYLSDFSGPWSRRPIFLRSHSTCLISQCLGCADQFFFS